MPTPQARRRRRILGTVLGVALGVLVVLVAAILVRTLTLTDAIRESQKPNTATLDLIRDCTQPGGKCFEDGQARTAEAVGSINLTQVAAVACADRPGAQTSVEILACVQRTMAKLDVQ